MTTIIRWTPSALSLARLLSSPLLLILILQGRFPLALVGFLLAVVSDHIDGKLARRLSVCTFFGAWIDPIADKVLMLFVLTGLLLKGICPAWFLALVFTIAVIQIAGIVLQRVLRPQFPIQLTPTPEARLASLALRSWLALLLAFPAPVGLAGHGVYVVLALGQIGVFWQHFHRSALHLVPLTRDLRQRK